MKACSAATCRSLLVGAIAVLLLGCSGPPSNGPSSSASGVYGLDVSGDLGTAPTVRMVTPMAVPRTVSETVVAGTGPAVQIDQLFVLQLTLYDARTGRRAASTYDSGQVPLVAKSSDDRLFPQLTAALVGKRQGSRIAVALSAADAYAAGGAPPPGVRTNDPVVVVADVVAVPPAHSLATAAGKPVAPPAGAPRVTLVAGDPTAVTAPPGGSAPTKVLVVPLINGTGAPVRNHSLVTLDYLGQAWGSAGPFADTYFKEPVVIPVGAEGSVPAWDRALVGLRRGSRVLIIDPNPTTSVPQVVSAPRRATIAWVVDVLGVS